MQLLMLILSILVLCGSSCKPKVNKEKISDTENYTKLSAVTVGEIEVLLNDQTKSREDMFFVLTPVLYVDKEDEEVVKEVLLPKIKDTIISLAMSANYPAIRDSVIEKEKLKASIKIQVNRVLGKEIIKDVVFTKYTFY